jgi:hypothetical protein
MNFGDKMAQIKFTLLMKQSVVVARGVELGRYVGR